MKFFRRLKINGSIDDKGQKGIIMHLIIAGDTTFNSPDGRNPVRGELGNIFKNSDGVILNLETVLTESSCEKKANRAVNFKGEINRVVKWLHEIEAIAVGVANNHVLDSGPEAFRSMVSRLQEEGFHVAGFKIDQVSQYSAVFTIDECSVGLIAAYTGNPRIRTGPTVLSEKAIIQEVKTLRAKVDILLVSLHWGEEYTFYPRPQHQRFARKLKGMGVDLLFGHHPHVFQGGEERRIFYAIGDLNLSAPHLDFFQNTREGILLQLEIDDKKIKEVSLIPVVQNTEGIPSLATPQQQDSILKRFEELSMPLDNILSSWGWYSHAAEVFWKNHGMGWKLRLRKHGLIKCICPFLRWALRPYTCAMILNKVCNRVITIHKKEKVK